MLRTRLVLTCALVALLAGCSTPTTAPPTEPTSTGSTAPEPTGIVLPPRPRELSLDGVDPCSLLTDTQRTELGLADGGELAGDSTAPGFVGPACVIRGYEPRAIAAVFALVTGNGIDVLTGPALLREDTTVITVEGFPAVLTRPENGFSCLVNIDIAADQFLQLQLQDGGRRPPQPQDQLCRDAEQVAAAAMRTLLTR